MKRRVVSFLLASCMTIALLPGNALAAEESPEPEAPPACTCETACTADGMNAACPVCGAAGASPEGCRLYQAPEEEPVPDEEGTPGEMPGDGETDGQTPEEETPPPANDGLEPLSDTHANHGADGTAADPITKWEEWDGGSGSFGGGGDRYLYLTEDTTGSITVQGNSRVYLCLNGYTLNGSITVGQSNLGGGGTLTICDCSAWHTGKIIGSSNGIIKVNGQGTLNLYGGTLSCDAGETDVSAVDVVGSATVNGAVTIELTNVPANRGSSAVHVWGGGSLDFQNGTVTCTASNGQMGYGIRVEDADVGDVTISGGNISYLRVASGTVNVSGGNFTSISVQNSGTLDMTGGSVDYTLGIGTAVSNSGTMTLSNAAISSNATFSNATGSTMWAAVNNTGALTVNDNVTITGVDIGIGNDRTSSSATVLLNGTNVKISATGEMGTGVNNSSGTLTIHEGADIDGGYIGVYGRVTLIGAPAIDGIMADLGVQSMSAATADAAYVDATAYTGGALTVYEVTLPDVHQTGPVGYAVKGLETEEDANLFTLANGGGIFEYPYDSSAQAIRLVNPSVHPVCGDANCTDGHPVPTAWTAWSAASGATLTGGSYYLTRNVTSISSTIQITGTVNLCLNGHTISGSAAGGIFQVAEGGTLTICDCQGGGTISGDGYGISVSSGSLTLYGGLAIEGETADLYLSTAANTALENAKVDARGYTGDGLDVAEAGTLSGLVGAYAIRGGEGLFTLADSTDTYQYTYENGGYVIRPRHTHSYTYTASGSTITETCSCGHSATAMISIRSDVSLVYTGSAIEPAEISYDEDWAGSKDLEITYVSNTDVGTATASITKETATASVTFQITAKAITGDVTIDGDAVYGEELTAKYTGTEDVRYQWYRGGVAITGAKSETYTLEAADVGYAIHVAVTGTGNYSGTATSAATAAVSKAGQDEPDANDYTIHYDEETITAGSGFEISSTNGGDATAIENRDISDLWGQTIYIRRTETDTHYASGWTAIPLPARPTAPTVTKPNRDNVTDSTITISTTEDYEYVLDTNPNPPTNWTGAVDGTGNEHTFEDLDGGKTYYLHVRVPASDDKPASAVQTVEIPTKGTQETPSAGESGVPGSGSITVTEDSITLSGTSGALEYIVLPAGETPEESDWEDAEPGTGGSLTFGGLEPGTKYVVYTRRPGSDTSMPSEAASVDAATAAKTPTDSDIAGNVTVDYRGETITVEGGYEVSTSEDFAQGTILTSPIPLTPGQTYYVRVPAKDGIPASKPVNFTTAERPGLPGSAVTVTGETILGKGDGSVSIPGGMEYSVDGGEHWTSGPAELTNQAARTEITVRVEAAEDAPHGVEQIYTVPASEETLTVTFEENGGSAVADATGLRYNATVTEPTTARAGYTFAGWYQGDAAAAFDFSTPITGNITLTARWTLDAPTAAITGAPEGGVTYDGTAVVTLTAVPGHEAAGVAYAYQWYKAGEALEGETASALALTAVADSGSYTVRVTARDGDGRESGAESAAVTVTIAPKALTVTWSGLTQTYGSFESGSVTANLSGLIGGDTCGVSYAYTQGGQAVNPGAAGTYTVTAASQNANYILSDSTATATLTIRRQTVYFTVTGSTVLEGEAAAPVMTPSVKEAAGSYTVTYRQNGQPVAGTPSAAGSYEIWVEFDEDGNYQAAGGLEAQIGTLTITARPVALYTVTFAAGGAGGTAPASQEGAAGSVITLPASSFAYDGYRFTGWRGGDGVLYQPGNRYTITGNATLTAQWQAVFSITGTVVEGSEDGDEVPGAVVTLMYGAEQLAQDITDEEGHYSFDDLVPGIYNLVVTHGGRTVTTMVEITDEDETSIAILPAYATNSLVSVDSSVPVVVGGLEESFSPEDVTTAQGGGTVEITLTATEKTGTEEDTAAEVAAIQEQAPSNVSLDLVMDYSLEKVVKDSDGSINNAASGPITEASVLLTLRLTLPASLQGKSTYYVYRYHNNEPQTMTRDPGPDEEGFTVTDGGRTLEIYSKRFSTYAIGYAEPTSSGGSSYRPAVEDTDHGTVTVSPSRPGRGDEVTVTPEPDEGYEVDEITVTDRSGNEVELTDNGDGTWSFTQPSGRVTIAVTFREAGLSDCPRDESCPLYGFADLNRNAWYHDGVHYCLENGLMVGTDPSVFSPDAATSRAMAAAILWRLSGSPAADDAADFRDVSDSAWYAEAVRWATGQGIVEGYGDGSFGPNDPVTREQLAAMLCRYAACTGCDTTASGDLSGFRDAGDVSGYAVDALTWAVQEALVNGVGDSTLLPQGPATRAQASAIFMRFVEHVMK